MTAHPLSEALKNSELLWSRQQLFAEISRLGRELDAVYADTAQPPVFLTVMNGGMFFGAYLAHASTIDAATSHGAMISIRVLRVGIMLTFQEVAAGTMLDGSRVATTWVDL